MQTSRPISRALAGRAALRLLSFLLCLLLAAGAAPQPGRALAPELTGVFPDDAFLTVGKPMGVSYEANVPGTLEMTVYMENGDISEPVETLAIEAGAGAVAWDGTLDGAPVSPGGWMVQLTLVDGGGARSEARSVFVEVVSAEDAAPEDEEAGEEEESEEDGAGSEDAESETTEQALFEPTEERQRSPFPDPHELCAWGLDIDHLDIYDPADQSKIWDVLMQPVTVFNVGPKEHVYPLVSPDADPKDPENMTGQLHGATAAVHILEELDNGWSLIEAFSADGYGGPSDKFHDLDNKLIQGYVKTRLLKTVKPYAKIGLVVDKYTQRLYVFRDGQLYTELLISTGFPTASQPWNETPSGEFLVDTWVGMFANGSLMCDLALRINGGCLLHEVPHKAMADGTRNYAPFEPYLGLKASHGCIRVQRMRNNDGVNMGWLWNNLKRNTKVLVWDDAGRATIPVPDWAQTVYYNADGGKSYHRDANCASVKARFLPLSPLSYQSLYEEPYSQLIPCYGCVPFFKAPDPAAAIPDDILGAEQTDY